MEHLSFKHITVAASAFFLISFWLHYPGLVPSNYTDIGSLWHRPEIGAGKVPYVDYNLEYPVLTGLSIYVSSIWDGFHAYYIVMSMILFASVMVGLYVVYRIFKMSNRPYHRIHHYIVFTPTFIYFSIYSWDWIGLSLLLLSMYFAYTQKAHLSGLFLGLSIAARIIPIVCLPFLLREFKSVREKVMFLLTGTVAWFAPHAYFMVKNWGGFMYTYTFQSSMGVEDSWLIFFGQFWPGRQNLSLVLMLTALAFIYFRRPRFNMWEACLLAMLAFVLTSYKFPPQYFILLLPLFAFNKTNYTLFMTANILNTMIILLFFTPAFNLGDQFKLTSPIQWIAIVRQLVLFSMLLSFFLLRQRDEDINRDRTHFSSPIT